MVHALGHLAVAAVWVGGTRPVCYSIY